MFGLLGDLGRAAVGVATLPISAAVDVARVVTISDDDPDETIDNVNRIVDNLTNASKPRR
jgi:hypothetical protein